MAAVDADRNLLFGVLALQADLIDNDRFAEACTAWSARKATPLAELLVERGWITAPDCSLVERLLQLKLQKHEGDVARSLADVANGPVERVLAGIDEPEIHQTLARLTRLDRGHILLSTIGYTPETRERYTLTRLHARGGIGQVWLARDADLGRDVALKELRPEQAGNTAVWTRFLEEACITGQLEHPNIVPVHELVRPGEDQKQTPFYTMRFVKGRTLTDATRDYHRRRLAGQAGPLDLRALLQNFIGVCNAVAYAHSRGVIHRDLKGQNVVLGDFGEVIVLDWGLAKLIDRADTQADAPPVHLKRDDGHAATMQGQALGTPAYMSPEQAEGRTDRVDNRSDVYGLGAILYEILANQPPFTGTETHEVLRKVREEAPQRPSQLNQETHKALEAVCLKALAKRPEDRYASVDELSQEVQRWLANEPVTAWREPWTIRAGRWLSRHRMLMATSAAAAAVALIGLAGVAWVQTRANRALQAAMERETRARDMAETRYNLAAEAIQAFYTGASEDVVLKQPQLQELRTRMLQTALKFYRQLEEQLEAQPVDPTRTNGPQNRMYALATAAGRIAEIYSLIGQQDEALKAYEKSRSLWEWNDTAAGYPDQLAKVFIKMGRLRRQLGQPAAAMQDYQRSVEIYERLIKSNGIFFQGGLAWALLQIGNLEEEMGRISQARQTLVRCRDLMLEKSRKDRLEGWERQNLGSAYMTLGNLDAELGQNEESLRYYEEAHVVLKKLVADLPGAVDYRVDLARTENNIGYALTELGRLDEALPRMEQGLTMREQHLAEMPLNASYRSDLARSEYYLTRLHIRAQRPAEALRHLEKAESLYAGLASKAPEDQFYQACLLALHIPLVGMGKPDLSAGEQADRQRYADQAMRALQAAVAMGYRRKDQFEHEHDLDPLRTRDDFQKMIKALTP